MLNFLGIGFLAQAQQEPINFTRFTVAEGLADNWVHTAIQDSKGFMWFGCEDGLSRFDGQHFLNFFKDKNNPNAISNNTVRGICEDPQDGSLWLAVLDGGLNRLDPATGRFEAWPTDPNNPEYKGELTSIVQDGDLLWLGSYHHGLGCFDKKKRQYVAWYSFPADEHSKETLQFNTVNHLLADRQNPRYLWIAAANRGLARFDKQTHHFEIWPIFDFSGKPGVSSMQLLQDRNGQVWIATWSSGVGRFDPSSSRVETYPYDLASYRQPNNYNRNVVLCLAEKGDNELWVGTEDNGLGSFDMAAGKFNFTGNKLSGESPEIDRVCQGFYTDARRRLWVLGRKGGIKTSAPSKLSFQYISLASGGGGTSERAEVTGFAYSTTRRTVFVATENNGCFEWSDEQGTLVQRASKLPDGSYPNFRAVCCDNSGKIWAGAAKTLGGSASLYALTPGKSSFEAVKLKFDPPRGLEETINGLLADKQGNIWVATSYDGFYKLNPSTLAVESFREQSSFADGAPAFNKWWVLSNISMAPDGKIWFALKNGGAIAFDPTSKKFDLCNARNGLPSNDVMVVEPAPNGQVYFAIKNDGLYVLNPTTGRIGQQVPMEKITATKSLKFTAVEYDGPTDLVWVATDQGLVRIGEGNKKIAFFNTSSGLRDANLIGKGLAILAPLGVFVGQPNGFCLLRQTSAASKVEPDTFNVVLSDIKVFNQSKYFEKRLHSSNEVVMQPYESVFSFAFAIPASLKGNIVPYQYQLEGFDENWFTSEDGQSITYASLQPGEYKLHVKASQPGNDFCPVSTLTVTVLPHWWQTWWAKTIAFAALGLLLFCGYKYRTFQLEKENMLLRQMNELERSALQAQMNPHFIFNCLNAIQNFILQNEKERAMNYLGDFASLVRGVLNASVTGQVTLSNELQILENYLKLEQLRFGLRFDFEIKVADGLDLHHLNIPPLLIQPYVENAVLHGMSGKKSGGRIDVFFQKKGNCLEVQVQDNGDGPKEKTSNKSYKSVGMTITRRRLELLNQKSGGGLVEIVQKTDANGAPSGTLVTIKIDLVS